MLVWIIVIAVLLLILLLPVGADVRYDRGALILKVKAGLLRFTILPEKTGRKAKKTPKAEQKTEKPKKEKVKIPSDQKKIRLTKEDIPTLLGIVFRLLRRLRKHLSIDRLKLWWAAAAEDPYDAVVQFGALNAGFSLLMPLAKDVLKIREEDIRTDVDFEAKQPQIIANVVATIQIWEILLIVICAAAAAGSWYLKKRKQSRTAAKAAAQKGME